MWGLYSALIAALLLGLINTFLRLLLILLTVLLLDLFTRIINGLLFWFTGSVLKGFEVNGFWVGVMGALLYSFFSFLLSLFLRQKILQQGPVIIDHDKL